MAKALADMQSIFWGGNRRIREAASVPFRSIYSRDTGDNAVALVKGALMKIAMFSAHLPASLLPRPFGKFGPPGAAWGPFEFKHSGSDPLQFEPSVNFNDLADIALRKFQRQDGSLDVDGKAGMATLHRLDEIVRNLDSLPPQVGIGAQ